MLTFLWSIERERERAKQDTDGADRQKGVGKSKRRGLRNDEPVQLANGMGPQEFRNRQARHRHVRRQDALMELLAAIDESDERGGGDRAAELGRQRYEGRGFRCIGRRDRAHGANEQRREDERDSETDDEQGKAEGR